MHLVITQELFFLPCCPSKNRKVQKLWWEGQWINSTIRRETMIYMALLLDQSP